MAIRDQWGRESGALCCSRRIALIGAVGAVPLVVAACGASTTVSGDPAASSTKPIDSGPPGPAQIIFTPADTDQGVAPTTEVSVKAINAAPRAVTLTDASGEPIEGTLAPSPDGLTWKAKNPLSYATAYTVIVKYEALGQEREASSSFTTITPQNMTLPYFESTGGLALNDNAVYGVGQVAVVHFDEPITDRAAAQRTLNITTDPPIEGAWSWTTDKTVAWRPKRYYPSGTKVTIEANVFGKEVSPGLWGQQDTALSFSIGESHISIADDATKQVLVYINGQVVRSMPTSMGQGGTETVNGKTLHFWTQRGIYTVLDKANPVVMDSSTYGLPINSRLGYRQTIGWATRISNDGIYLHALDNIAAQGVRNESHGCLNLSPDNAQWFFGISQPGDVVEVRNTGGPSLEQWQNGDWSVPWESWVAGSALPDDN